MSVPVVLPEPVVLRINEWLSGRVTVGAARLLLITTRGRPAPLMTVLGAVGRGAQPASVEGTLRARAIVETVSLRCASPHGWLPRSLAVLLLCRWHGQRVNWRVGMHSPPPSPHAWIEVAGQPVGKPFDPHRLYTPIISFDGKDTQVMMAARGSSPTGWPAMPLICARPARSAPML